jgi:transcriptional regulator with XRE-family HTH domain
MSATEKTAPKNRMKKSTAREPYHYVQCGLPNVWLVGVEYSAATDDAEQAVGIPCLPALLDALAKTVAEKPAALTADELRFLRKRMRYASKDFATVVGLSPEQYSRIENGPAAITPMLDKLVRFLYAAKAKLPKLADEAAAPVKWVAERTREERIVATQDEEHHWVIQTRAA